jgi:hypothetical protein
VCEVPEIATITRHSLNDVEAILRRRLRAPKLELYAEEKREALDRRAAHVEKVIGRRTGKVARFRQLEILTRSGDSTVAMRASLFYGAASKPRAGALQGLPLTVVFSCNHGLNVVRGVPLSGDRQDQARIRFGALRDVPRAA